MYVYAYKIHRKERKRNPYKKFELFVKSVRFCNCFVMFLDWETWQDTNECPLGYFFVFFWTRRWFGIHTMARCPDCVVQNTDADHECCVQCQNWSVFDWSKMAKVNGFSDKGSLMILLVSQQDNMIMIGYKREYFWEEKWDVQQKRILKCSSLHEDSLCRVDLFNWVLCFTPINGTVHVEILAHWVKVLIGIH